jgi:hypothetical protein
MKKLLLLLALLQTPQALIEQILTDAQTLRDLLGPATVEVAAGEDLQAALSGAPAGVTVALAPATFPGTVTLSKPVTLTTQDWVPGGQTAVLTGTVIIDGPDVSLIGLEITGNHNDIVQIRSGASNTVLQSLFIHGDPLGGAKRGIQANGNGWTLKDSTITDIFRVGQESAGIGSWNTPGPCLIENNRIEAASINILFGGADPQSEAHIPTNCVIRGNIVKKKPEWRGQGFAVKNLFELKNARGFLVEQNLFQYSWVDGQTGYGIVLAVRNQSGTAPYSVVENVIIQNNIVRDVGTAVSILGRDTNYPSQTMRNVTFRDNTFENIDRRAYGGRGATFEIIRGPENLAILGTRVVNSPLDLHSALFFGQGSFSATGLIVRDNFFIEGQYGVIGDGTLNASFGLPALGAYAPGYLWENNVVKKSGIRAIQWPAGTSFE